MWEPRRGVGFAGVVLLLCVAPLQIQAQLQANGLNKVQTNVRTVIIYEYDSNLGHLDKLVDYKTTITFDADGFLSGVDRIWYRNPDLPKDYSFPQHSIFRVSREGYTITQIFDDNSHGKWRGIYTIGEKGIAVESAFLQNDDTEAVVPVSANDGQSEVYEDRLNGKTAVIFTFAVDSRSVTFKETGISFVCRQAPKDNPLQIDLRNFYTWHIQSSRMNENETYCSYQNPDGSVVTAYRIVGKAFCSNSFIAMINLMLLSEWRGGIAPEPYTDEMMLALIAFPYIGGGIR